MVRVRVSHFIICLYSCSLAHCTYLYFEWFGAALHLALTKYKTVPETAPELKIAIDQYSVISN